MKTEVFRLNRSQLINLVIEKEKIDPKYVLETKLSHTGIVIEVRSR